MIFNKYYQLKNQSFVESFFNKYSNIDNPLLKVLCGHLQTVCSDIEYIKGRHENEQWAIDYADALNELSLV